MDYEKAYKDALERAKRLYKDAVTLQLEQDIKDYETIFPELKESEDEKIRKELLTWLQNTEGQVLPMDRYNAALAWLEKQGEQKPQRMISAEAKEAMYNKPADTVEPKFKIGDSIKTANEEPLTITEITDNGYWSEDLFICNFDDAAKWELVEQKPADKVEPKCEESKTKIFDAPTPFEDKLYAFVAACEFLAIPSKIEFILEHSQEILDAAREQIGKEQSSAWSEEDERKIQDCIDAVSRVNLFKVYYQNELVGWLKSLKTKVQPKQEWSEKDEEELEIAIDTLKESGRYDSAKWVQSLKRRIGGKL